MRCMRMRPAGQPSSRGCASPRNVPAPAARCGLISRRRVDSRSGATRTIPPLCLARRVTSNARDSVSAVTPKRVVMRSASGAIVGGCRFFGVGRRPSHPHWPHVRPSNSRTRRALEESVRVERRAGCGAVRPSVLHEYSRAHSIDGPLAEVDAATPRAAGTTRIELTHARAARRVRPVERGWPRSSSSESDQIDVHAHTLTCAAARTRGLAGDRRAATRGGPSKPCPSEAQCL